MGNNYGTITDNSASNLILSDQKGRYTRG